jgi:hypothetical protein
MFSFAWKGTQQARRISDVAPDVYQLGLDVLGHSIRRGRQWGVSRCSLPVDGYQRLRIQNDETLPVAADDIVVLQEAS